MIFFNFTRNFWEIGEASCIWNDAMPAVFPFQNFVSSRGRLAVPFSACYWILDRTEVFTASSPLMLAFLVSRKLIGLSLC